MRQLLMLTTVFLLMATGSARAMEGPWSVSSDAPAIEEGQPGERGRSAMSGEVTPFVFLIRGFQRYISPVDGDRCNMYPTCSSYGLHAFRKHGTLRGIVLTADRLLHEYDEAAFAPRIVRHGTIRYYDPVEYNDFWWSK